MNAVKMILILLLAMPFSAWASPDHPIEVTLLLKKPVNCFDLQRQLVQNPFHVRCSGSDLSRVYPLVYYGEPNRTKAEIRRLKTLKNVQEAQIRVSRALSIPK